MSQTQYTKCFIFQNTYWFLFSEEECSTNRVYANVPKYKKLHCHIFWIRYVQPYPNFDFPNNSKIREQFSKGQIHKTKDQ